MERKKGKKKRVRKMEGYEKSDGTFFSNKRSRVTFYNRNDR